MSSRDELQDAMAELACALVRVLRALGEELVQRHARRPTVPSQEADRTPDATILLTAEEVAQRLRIGRSTVYALAARGELPGITIGRIFRMREADLEDWLRSRRR